MEHNARRPGKRTAWLKELNASILKADDARSEEHVIVSFGRGRGSCARCESTASDGLIPMTCPGSARCRACGKTELQHQRDRPRHAFRPAEPPADLDERVREGAKAIANAGITAEEAGKRIKGRAEALGRVYPKKALADVALVLRRSDALEAIVNIERVALDLSAEAGNHRTQGFAEMLSSSAIRLRELAKLKAIERELDGVFGDIEAEARDIATDEAPADEVEDEPRQPREFTPRGGGAWCRWCLLPESSHHWIDLDGRSLRICLNEDFPAGANVIATADVRGFEGDRSPCEVCGRLKVEHTFGWSRDGKGLAVANVHAFKPKAESEGESHGFTVELGEPVTIPKGFRLILHSGTRVVVDDRAHDSEAGKAGTLVGDTIELNGIEWAPLVWDGDEDPTWFKLRLLNPNDEPESST